MLISHIACAEHLCVSITATVTIYIFYYNNYVRGISAYVSKTMIIDVSKSRNTASEMYQMWTNVTAETHTYGAEVFSKAKPEVATTATVSAS